jgi:hypothetical protein
MKKNHKLTSVISSVVTTKKVVTTPSVSVPDLKLNALHDLDLLDSSNFREGRVTSYLAVLESYLPAILAHGIIPSIYSSVKDSRYLHLSMNARNSVFKLMEQMKDRSIVDTDPVQSIVLIGCYTKKSSILVKEAVGMQCPADANRAFFGKKDLYGNCDFTHVIGSIVEIKRTLIESTKINEIMTTRNSTIGQMPVKRFSYQLTSHYGDLDNHLAHKMAIYLGFTPRILREAKNNVSEVVTNSYLDSVIWYGYHKNSTEVVNQFQLSSTVSSNENPVLRTKYAGVKSIKNRNIYKIRYKRLSLVS